MSILSRRYDRYGYYYCYRCRRYNINRTDSVLRPSATPTEDTVVLLFAVDDDILYKNVSILVEHRIIQNLRRQQTVSSCSFLFVSRTVWMETTKTNNRKAVLESKHSVNGIGRKTVISLLQKRDRNTGWWGYFSHKQPKNRKVFRPKMDPPSESPKKRLGNYHSSHNRVHTRLIHSFFIA